MDMQVVLNKIPVGVIAIRTLGGRSTFTLSRTGNHLIITNTGGNSKTIDVSYWNDVRLRRKSLGPDRNTATEYTDPAWPNAPDRIFPPYVAAVMRHFGG